MALIFEVQRICEFCGKEFTAHKTITRYCSHTCNGKAYKRSVKELRIELNNKETKQVITKPIEELKAKEFLSVREAAILLGCSRQCMYSLINSGKVKGVNLMIKKTIIPRAEIDKLFMK